MMRLMAVLVASVMVLISCGKTIDEEMVKEGIRAWWDAEGIEDVLVQSFSKSGNSMVFNACLVVSGDTLERMNYEFQKGMTGWALKRGPFEEEQRRFLLAEVGLAHIDFFQKQRELVEMFKGVMDMYGSYTGGKFPLLLETQLDAIPGYKGDKGEETVLSMIRPFLEGELPFVDALGDTSSWYGEYGAKIVYFPLQREQGFALQYAVRAGMDTCFVDDIMKRWREDGDTR